MLRFATLALLFTLAVPVRAQVPGSCETGNAESDLYISDVNARVFNTGSLFYGNATTNGDGYLVPEPTLNSPIFAAGIWIGGLVDGEVRLAGATYRDFEFWPGPLGDDGRPVDPDDCSPFDKIWNISAYEVAYLEATGVALGDVGRWPVELGAPVIDGDGVEGNYNLEGGDRPALYGHQTAFWVMNDVGSVHNYSQRDPLGIEVRVTAFSSIESSLDQQTFYRYEVVNKSPNTIEAGRFGLFVDPDLGDAGDDLAGVDTTRSMAFVYNGQEEDALYGIPPAAGYDLLSGGAGAHMPFFDGGPVEPSEGIEMYRFMQGLWGDGTPLTEFGTGFMTDGPVTTWWMPGDPVTGQFWSEENRDGNGGSNFGSDRRHLFSTEPFVLPAGEARTFDLAILFGQGADRLNSITVLRAASDLVQARYDAGNLFAPSALTFPPPGSLATPELLTPDGTFFVGEAILEWTPVFGAEGYRLEYGTDPGFEDSQIRGVGPGATASFYSEPNATTTYYWRVKATAGPEQSFYSETRSFTVYTYVPVYFGNGERIVELSYPGVGDVCAGAPADPGCIDGLGNTVFADPNSTADYAVTVSGDALYDADASDLALTSVFESEDFEIRFTEECATFGNCLGAYVRDDAIITSVPFELWNLGPDDIDGTGGTNDPSDDVRMIPVIRDNDGPVENWADTFTDEAGYITADGDTVSVGVTEEVFFAQPDRPDGYALFEAAANGFGGPGAVYDNENDGDTQVDLNANGEPCSRQGWYIDFCFRAVPPFRFPIQDVVFADLAGDGTTPPAGTTIRFVTNDPLFVDAEDEAAQPSAFGITAAYPNPFRASVTVEYTLATAGETRLSVYDVLGRRVAVLEDGWKSAGPHRAKLPARGLASGVYLVVLEAGGERQVRRVTVAR